MAQDLDLEDGEAEGGAVPEESAVSVEMLGSGDLAGFWPADTLDGADWADALDAPANVPDAPGDGFAIDAADLPLEGGEDHVKHDAQANEDTADDVREALTEALAPGAALGLCDLVSLESLLVQLLEQGFLRGGGRAGLALYAMTFAASPSWVISSSKVF